MVFNYGLRLWFLSVAFVFGIVSAYFAVGVRKINLLPKGKFVFQSYITKAAGKDLRLLSVS